MHGLLGVICTLLDTLLPEYTGGEMFTYILDKSCKALSVLLGWLWEEKNCFCTSSCLWYLVVGIVDHILLIMHNAYCALEAQLKASSLLDNVTTHLSLRLYQPQTCFLESDPMIIARLLKAVLHNRSTSPLVSDIMCLSNRTMPTFTLYTVYILAVTAERTLFNLLLLWIFILILE